MSEYIHHDGIVISCEGKKVRVRILQTSACASCQVKNMCMSSDNKERIVDAWTGDEVKAGDQVEVMVMETMGWKAVVLAYIVPLIVLVSIAGIASILGWGEVMIGVSAIAGVAVYYGILRLFKDKLGKSFDFIAIRKDTDK